MPKSKGWRHATGKRLTPGRTAIDRALVNGETSVNEVIGIVMDLSLLS
jgi:hypothetical protein